MRRVELCAVFLSSLMCASGCQKTTSPQEPSPQNQEPAASATASVQKGSARKDADGTRPFVTTWVGKRVRIPLPESSGLTYKYDVDCDGDGTYEVTGQDTNMSCKYEDDGPHTIAIRGQFPHMQADEHLGETLRSVDQWGDIEWHSMFSMFEGARHLEINATDAPDLSKVKSLHGMFHGAEKMNQPVGHWDTSKVEDMSAMFQDAYAFNQDISSWDTSSVKDMSLMFRSADAFDQNISGWDVSRVTTMSQMFHRAMVFDQPLDTWDTSSVTDMSGMFKSTRKFNQPLGTWNTSSVTKMDSMFSEATAFNQPIGDWDTSKVEAMHNIFAFNPVFNQPVGKWDVSNVYNLSGIFWKATAFDQALDTWNFKSMGSTQKILSESGLSRKHYDALIEAWAARPPEVDRELIIDADGLKFCEAREARQRLIKDKGWTFEGDELSCD